jgi:acetyl-CoA carboxylase beta subunit
MATSESETSGKAKMTREKRGVPGGLWLRCDDCGETIFRKEAEQLMSVCPQCGYHAPRASAPTAAVVNLYRDRHRTAATSS